ncbi:MAG: permease-like cell division protein FtsX [Patescibacteria group bacterium]
MKYQTKSAITSIKRFPYQSLAAIFLLTVTFLVVTILAVVSYSSGKVIAYFETRPQVIAFLKDGTTTETISALQHKLQNDLRIKEVKYVSKEEALSIYKDATIDNPLLGELVNPSIFPASLEFSLNDLSKAQGIIEEVKSEAIVDSVGFTASLGGEKSLGDVVERLRKITLYLKLGGGFFALLLTGTSFLVLVITLGMRIASRRGEVEILNLIGAKKSFIKKPIIIESIIYVVSGVTLGWLMILIAVLYIAPSAINYFGEIPVLPRSPLMFFSIFGIILLSEAVMGILLATIGSNLALSRASRKK